MAGDCVHCGICTKNCTFLQKYNIDIGDTEKLQKLAYHCFLCGKCTEVCPRGIDGREKILNLREEYPNRKGYGMLLAEKKRYLFKNYRRAQKKSVLFPGCNFPSFYPETTEYLVKILSETANMGVIYDCCGKPVAELGLKSEKEKIIDDLNRKFEKSGVEEVVMVCPNCYSFLKSKLNVKVISIYEKLEELQIGKKLDKEIQIFLPCPERENSEMLRSMKVFLAGSSNVMKEVTCCGLGGCASVKEPELAKEMASSMQNKEVYTYCASCASNFARNGCKEVHHILVEILKTNEFPDTGNSFVNRVKTKFL